MTKTKYFTHGNFEFKAYCKPVGHGFECGIMHKGTPIFMGNFVHKYEVTKWWGTMNKELKSFYSRYEFSTQTPERWYCGFLSNHMNKCYYNYLDKVFATHTRYYAGAFKKDVKKYKRYQKAA